MICFVIFGRPKTVNEMMLVKIGQGCHGAVYGLSSYPTLVLKKSLHLQKKSCRNAFLRETFFLRYMQKHHPDLVIRLNRFWIRGRKRGYQLLERGICSAKELGFRQTSKAGIHADSRRTFYVYQIKQMIKLCRKLDSSGVVHGDAKLANLLYMPNKEFRWSDFGFAGFRLQKPKPLMGFTVNHGFPRSFRSLSLSLQRKWNRVQFFIDLVYGRPTYVYIRKTQRFVNIKKLKRFIADDMGLTHQDLRKLMKLKRRKSKT